MSRRIVGLIVSLALVSACTSHSSRRATPTTRHSRSRTTSAIATGTSTTTGPTTTTPLAPPATFRTPTPASTRCPGRGGPPPEARQVEKGIGDFDGDGRPDNVYTYTRH